jgi:hypothetical protein
MTADALESALCTTHSCGSWLRPWESVADVSLFVSGQVISVVAYHGWLGAGTALALTSLA